MISIWRKLGEYYVVILIGTTKVEGKYCHLMQLWQGYFAFIKAHCHVSQGFSLPWRGKGKRNKNVCSQGLTISIKFIGCGIIISISLINLFVLIFFYYDNSMLMFFKVFKYAWKQLYSLSKYWEDIYVLCSWKSIDTWLFDTLHGVSKLSTIFFNVFKLCTSIYLHMQWLTNL
jgi:hypothetical protein